MQLYNIGPMINYYYKDALENQNNTDSINKQDESSPPKFLTIYEVEEYCEKNPDSFSC